jgi:arabinose-5-phosphate isomerase
MASHAQSVDPSEEIAFIRSVLVEEADAVAALSRSAGEDFCRACTLIESCAQDGGTVLVSGLGKSGLVGAKIAATLSSLGIPAHAVHPTEAAHGDLGRFRPRDVAICLSQSGETEEVVALAATLRQDGIPIVAITSGSMDPNRPSSLERLASVVILIGVKREAGGFVAPTASTTAAMAAADAIALAVARRRAFSQEDFARRHPGGTLGGLLRPVSELLRFRVGVNLPLVRPQDSVLEALDKASQAARRPGALLVVDDAGRLAGIFTDGDLRRLVLRGAQELSRPIADVMTRNPRCLQASATATDAANLLREHRQDETPVLDVDGKPIGLLDVQDLIALKLVKD